MQPCVKADCIILVLEYRMNEVLTTIEAQLQLCYNTLRSASIPALFEKEKNRFSVFSFSVDELFFDFSKNWIDSSALQCLIKYAENKNLHQARQDLFSGEKINRSENKNAWHVALRFEKKPEAVSREFEKIKNAIQQIPNHIDTIIHIGLGGSGIGPKLYYQALKTNEKMTCHFLTNYDLSYAETILSQCNPENTMVVTVSKSFQTRETILLFEYVSQWMRNHFFSEEKIMQKNFAVTEKKELAEVRGFLTKHIFTLWDWVGGRFSIWSPASFSVIAALGFPKFEAFLSGAKIMDQHFLQAPLQKNAPVLLALLSWWYTQFFKAQTHVIIAYSEKLTLLTNYLQQLHMESLGKSANQFGEKINYSTGNIIWGDVGPASQHSFHQLLMQGTHFVPIDFILPLGKDYLDVAERASHCLSQSETLLYGAKDIAEKNIVGNKPSTTILLKTMDAKNLGALLALYEHSVFAQSVLLDVNAFDQWGVERGKKVGQTILSAFTQNTKQANASTQGLIEKIKEQIS